MTGISQKGIQAWGNFVLEKQIAKLMYYYYYLFQIWKYLCILTIDINSYRKCLFADGSTGRKSLHFPT